MLRVWGIFTPMSISLSPGSRQCGSRYAIRAGRNLPDKEFRYLRTVIVTAAVYWGFNSLLAQLLLTFQHRAGVGPYTSCYHFAEPCVFNKQSLPPILCYLHLVAQSRPPLSRSYGCILPSSFNIILPSALVFSTCPPVSVSGTVLMMELFPGTASLQTQSVKHLQLIPSVTTIRSRNINRVPIDYGFRPHLRGRLTLRGLTLRRNPWAFGESVSHTLYRYSCQHSHF